VLKCMEYLIFIEFSRRRRVPRRAVRVQKYTIRSQSRCDRRLRANGSEPFARKISFVLGASQIELIQRRQDDPHDADGEDKRAAADGNSNRVLHAMRHHPEKGGERSHRKQR